MTDTRTRIATHVSATPGIHFNALVRELNLAPGQAQYHLRDLRREEELVRERLYGKTQYYPPGYDDRERRVLALLRRETARDILCYLIEYGPARPAVVSDDLDIARSTLEWQLDRLLKQDLVEKQYGAEKRVRLVLVAPSEAARLLQEVTPSVSERLADRFVRLTDRLLSDAENGEG
jgi:predicted transcriptional regulator